MLIPFFCECGKVLTIQKKTDVNLSRQKTNFDVSMKWSVVVVVVSFARQFSVEKERE